MNQEQAMPSGLEVMNGAQKYVGKTNPADAQAKREIAATVSAGMRRNPSFAAQPRYTGGK